MESGEEEEDAAWWRPVWADEETEPPGALRRPKPAGAPDYGHPLLAPLARAQDAVARLEARADAADPGIAEGLRARMAYREAAGWLQVAQVGIHPRDLALRDAGLTGAYGPAAVIGRLEAELPTTTAQGYAFEIAPSDRAIERALRFAHLWRRLAEFRSWKPLADAAAMRETLRFLGPGRGFVDTDIAEWLTAVEGLERSPPLIRAGRAAREWMNRGQVTEPLTVDGLFLAACLWRQGGYSRAIALPFWVAPETRLNRLAPRIGIEWLAGFLDCVADAAKAGIDELNRLQTAAEKALQLPGTARSKLPDAFDAVLRAPVTTAGSLAIALDITPQGALGLLRQLLEIGIVREATGRASWRAFVLS